MVVELVDTLAQRWEWREPSPVMRLVDSGAVEVVCNPDCFFLIHLLAFMALGLSSSWQQRTPLPARPRRQEDEEALCVVCTDGTSVEPNKILFCERCDLAVHQHCYGLADIPEGASKQQLQAVIGTSTSA
jgi:hypothetical protein